MASPINLCYQAYKYTFVATLTPDDIKEIRTRRLLGAHKWVTMLPLLIMETDRIALFGGDLLRMYNIPDAGFRIHLNVPVADVMDYICPTSEDLSVLIYFE
jgi:hypothetical protein